MSQSLIFLIGLAIGFIGGFVVKSNLGADSKIVSYPTDMDTFEAVLEQYLNELESKQQEILHEFNQSKASQPSPNQALGRAYHDKAEQVIHLLSQGYNYTEVAQKLGLGTGEVELIYQLKNNEITH